ncbi:MAG TPA: hypothetical protein VIH01_13090 [Blastococcus sp.]
MAGSDAGRPTAVAARRRRGPVLRGLLTAVAFVVASVLSLGVATAAPPGSNTVTPLLDCTTQNSDGSYTAVLGYSNTAGATATIPFGPLNFITPRIYDGVQPTTFLSGTRHGVFSLNMPAHANLKWRLDGHTLALGNKPTLSSSCPAPTQLPAEGNDTGAAVALTAAGVLGMIVLARVRRRILRAEENRTREPVS